MSDLQPIAIVGIAAELPSGEHSSTNLSHEAFHEFILEGKDAYVKIPAERMDIDAWEGRGLGQTSVTRGTFLKNVEMFDATEFGITSKDARAMAVGTRKLIELSFLALLDSGIDYHGRNVGCYAASTAYNIITFADPAEFESTSSFAGNPCMVANKISYHLDLRGPSIPIDTACSSTAVALHMAVQEIRSGSCEAAVVAGCQINLRAPDWPVYSRAGIIAPDGVCKPFDASANGFSRGEGAVVVVLKPLDQAIRDGDHIYGSILGTGVTSSGSLAPISAPVAEAQADAMLRAYAGTGRSPAEVDYVEVHGTGTAAGDPVEANWVGEYFGNGRDQEILMGSVKGNIGHLEITSFLAQLSKICSLIHTGQLAPQAHLRNLNPAIHWVNHKLRVARTPERLVARDPSGKLLVSICSSGIGGVNAHVIVEGVEPAGSLPAPSTTEQSVLLIAGGLSPRSASAVGENIAEALAEREESVIDFSVVLGRRARSLTWRTFAVKQLGQQVQWFSAPVLRPRSAPSFAFLLSGQGPQHINMGRQLFERYPAFRQTVLELDECFRQRTGTSLINDFGLFMTASTARTLPPVWPISLILPSIAVLQLALIDLFESFNFRPDLLIGHSAGETAMLYASGAGPKEMALEIAIARGAALSIAEKSANGTMAALSCSPELAEHIMTQVSEQHPGKVIEIACYNSPDAVALAGHAVLLDEAIAIAQAGGIMARRIQTSVPVHSSLMDICADEFKKLVGDVFARYPGEHRTKIPTYSTCTGRLLDQFTAQYFWDNTRSPVQFTSAVHEVLENNPNVQFIEIGPHPVLSTYITELGVSSATVSTMRRSKAYVPHQEQTTLLTAVGQAIVAGYSRVCFNSLNHRQQTSVVPRPTLPAYPFAKKVVELFPEYSRLMHRQMSPRNGPLNHPDLRINVATHPELSGHIINSEPIMPASGFVEMALEFGAKTLWNVKFHSMLSLSAPSPVPVEVVASGKYFSIKSHPVNNGKYYNHDPSSLRLHADGYFTTDIAPRPADLDLTAVMQRCAVVEIKDFYKELSHFTQYGPTFQRVDELRVNGVEVLARVKGLSADLAIDSKYVLHPALLDATLHAGIHPRVHMTTDPNVYYLPERVNSIFVYDTLDASSLSSEHLYAYATFQSWTPSELVYDMILVTPEGRHLCKLQGYVMARHLQVPEDLSQRYELIFRPFGILAVQTGDVGSDEPIDDADHLQNTCIDIVRHVIVASKKSDLRILEAQSADTPLVSRRLEDVLEEMETIFPAFFIIPRDRKPIAADAAPQYFSALQADSSTEPLLAELDTQTIDLAILPADSAVDNTLLERLRTVLVPGGFVVCATASTEPLQADLSSAGFENIIISGAIVYAQAPVLPLMLPTIHTVNQEMMLIPYTVGNEMAIQGPLRALDDTYDRTIWLVATEGYDADGLQGFGRSLRREYPQWNIRLAAFASSYSDDERRFIIEHFLPQTGMECEFLVDTGFCIKVPRIIASPPPKTSVGSIARTAAISLEVEEVLITALHVSFSETGVWVIVGTVTATGGQVSNAQLLGKAVLTVATKSPSEAVRVPQTAVAVIPDHLRSQALADCVPSLLFAVLVLGRSVLDDPGDFMARVVVSHTDDDNGKLILALCKTLRLQHASLPSAYSPEQLFKLQLNADDVILTASDPEDEPLRSFASPQAQVCSWTTSNTIQSCLRRQPRLVVKAVEGLCGLQGLASLLAVRSTQPEAPVPPAPPLFSADKSYILTGGVGSVGPHVARWMYENGARNLVLTSRSGRGTLKKMAGSLPERVFHYVEQLPNLKLSVEAVDAADPSSMAKLVGDLKKPLGGVLLLAAIWDDRLFLDQDEDSFTKCFIPKVGSFRALEAIVDIGSLDFVVSMSSGTTFGNQGQTNYTSANTALDGIIKKYPNAFSIATPLVHDTVIATERVASGTGWIYWACSPGEMCNYIEDGLRKLADGPLNIYVPAVDFDVAQKNLGPSALYDHLIRKTRNVDATGDGANLVDVLTPLLLQFIDVSAEDFSPEVPFTSYGLDSLSAGRLSVALRPWIVMSQMQLLTDVSLLDLEARIMVVRATKSETQS
ncbi:Polyketide synthase [Mycena venus]|uniref:Polyketide synthase n=1 Tax=Mycena venus TaxID=2733690 RepID=A0A8H7CAX2_9AGAR|nr:Polyketide synthase [Mycena venus]